MVNIYTPPREITALPPDSLVDLFGRLRVSSPETQVQIKQDSTFNRELTCSYGLLSGAGIAGIAEDNTFTMRGTGTSAFYRFRSRICGLYQNGKSLLIFFTFNFNGNGGIGVTKRAGYFSSVGSTTNVDGIYLEQEDGVTYWCIGNKIQDEREKIGQALWNEQTLDWSKSQIGYISFEYLGAGNVECGFVQDRKLTTSHIFSHKNELIRTYMASPNQFISYDLILNRATTTPTDFTAICATCLIEGGQQRTGYPFSISRWTTFTLATNVVSPVIVFRNTIPNHRVLISDFEISIGANASILVEIYKINTISALGTANGIENGVEYWFPTTNLTFTGKSLVSSSATQVTRKVDGSFSLNLYLETKFDDSPEYYALVVRSNANNTPVLPSIINLVLET